MLRRYKGFLFFAHMVMIMVSLCVFLPFLLLFLSSVTDESTLLNYGYSFFPEKLSLGAYRYIFMSSNKILRSYGMTILVTAVGTSVSVIISALFSYPLSLRNLPFRKTITFFVFFTMLFNGGIVPSYILWSTYLGVKDTVFGLILPNMLVSAVNILLIRSYFQGSIPDTLYEAAQIDGANQGRVFTTIVIPLGKPILITTGTFTGIAYWNDWTNGLYFINRRTDLFTIQNLLNRMVTDLQFLSSNSNLSASFGAEIAKVPTTGVQMAIAFVAILPILILFPFLQKYYAKGISLGAVKG
jgi:putative aldouronate transport system permease protein